MNASQTETYWEMISRSPKIHQVRNLHIAWKVTQFTFHLPSALTEDYFFLPDFYFFKFITWPIKRKCSINFTGSAYPFAVVIVGAPDTAGAPGVAARDLLVVVRLLQEDLLPRVEVEGRRVRVELLMGGHGDRSCRGCRSGNGTRKTDGSAT